MLSLFQKAATAPKEKTGLRAHVHIVDAQELIEMTKWHPFNKNLLKDYGKDKNFPLFLNLYPEGYPFTPTYFIICDDQKRFIASATLASSDDEKNKIILSQISVHHDFRGQGYATRLLFTIKDYLNIERPDIQNFEISKFEPMGKRYLEHKIIEMAPEFKANIFQRQSIFDDEDESLQSVLIQKLEPTN